MADSAKIQYNGSVVVSETLEGGDTSNTSTMIHSRVDKALGGSFNFSPASVTEFSIVTGLETTVALVDINFTDLTTGHVKATFYDGMTAADEASVDFFFATIESALSTGTPDCTFKFGNSTAFQPMLKGVGDFCIIPMVNYNQGTSNFDVEVISSGATTTAKITVLMANRD
jgi:hypothetical protein